MHLFRDELLSAVWVGLSACFGGIALENENRECKIKKPM
jgi:hypothetical protein